MATRKILKFFLDGEGAERYLPFARSKLTQMNRMPGGSFLENVYLVDDATIKVSKGMDLDAITISLNKVKYEFFTSDHVISNSLASPGHAAGYTNTYVCGSFTQLKNTGGLPRYSSTLTHADTDPWVARNCEADVARADPVITWESWQNQKFFEHAWWPDNGKKSLVTSCQAQAPGLLSTCNWQSAHTSCQIGNSGHLVTDIALDVVPAFYDASGSKVGGPTFDDPWVWWRRGCVATADNGRQFFICTDNYGRFHVYPFKDYAPTFQTTSYKTYTPPYPGWVTVPSIATEKIANQWLWTFNKDGTKCVSLPYHSVASEYYKYARNYPGAILPEQVALLQHPEYTFLGREDTPGLVEFGIAIAAGDDEDDYTATFTLLRNDYFATSGRYIFDAGYALTGAYTVAGVKVAEDTLVTAEIECFTPVGAYQEGPVTVSTIEFVDIFQTLRADMAFYANDAFLGTTELRRIPVIEGRSGRFLTINGYRTSLTPGNESFLPSGVGVNLPLAAGGSQFFYAIWPSPYFLDSQVGTKNGFLYASDVRSGSVIYEVDDYVTNTAQVVGAAFGKDFYNDTSVLGSTIADPHNPVADVKIPPAGRRIYLYALAASINTEWGAGFNVHPMGHWSCQASAGVFGNDAALRKVFDIVQPKNGPRRTHKQLFNSAFKQSRDYSYYLESFTGKYLYDAGSFRTFGIWVTF